MGYDFFTFKCDKLSGDYCTVTGDKVSRDQKNDICTSSSYLDNCEIHKRCYIVTAVSEMLKANKQSLYIASMFRSKLERNQMYSKSLAIYDAIGPVIANRIRGNERICRILFERTIKPACELIEAGQDEIALKQFIDMVTQFIEPEYRTNQENTKPNGVFTELMVSDSTTIRDCEQTATTQLCMHRIDEMTRPPMYNSKKLELKPQR